MAVTKILPIRSTIQRSVDYICDPTKTEGSLLTHSEHCVPQTAGQIFHHHLNQCRAGGNTIGRHLIQSFAPNEVDPTTAHEIGKRLAEEILGGRYAYVLATHVDRGHIHNHFIWGAADMVSHKRYRSNKGTYHEIRNISDRLCKEQNLSVIVPQSRGKSYDNYYPEKTSQNWRDKLQATIDNLIPMSKNFEDFLKQMESKGYKVKRGKHISFQAPEQERFTRAKRIGTEYTEDAIKDRIANSLLLQEQKALAEKEQSQQPVQAPSQSKNSQLQSPTHAPQQEQKPSAQKPTPPLKQAPKPLLPLGGIALWESIIRRRNTAEIYNLMQQNGGYNHFVNLMTESRIAHETIDNAIKANESRIAAWGYLREDIVDLNRTHKIYNEYKALQKSTKFFAKRTADKFYAKHEDEIYTHEKALRELKDCKRPLPTVKEIDEEIAKGKNANVQNAKLYRTAKAEHTRFTTVHRKLYVINNEHKPKAPQRQKQRSRDDGLSI
ncbi:MAG: relaxase/mobilization nuclease domain-containing protein [Defluviitaleaceae bacterium]|nr:relaxase/mobilization nuclease domain-containing protein [Defluviitaleaceae bacterium]